MPSLREGLDCKIKPDVSTNHGMDAIGVLTICYIYCVAW
jgi:hypothetical protein